MDIRRREMVGNAGADDAAPTMTCLGGLHGRGLLAVSHQPLASEKNEYRFRVSGFEFQIAKST